MAISCGFADVRGCATEGADVRKHFTANSVRDGAQRQLQVWSHGINGGCDMYRRSCTLDA